MLRLLIAEVSQCRLPLFFITLLAQGNLNFRVKTKIFFSFFPQIMRALSERQIRMGFDDNSGNMILFLNKTHSLKSYRVPSRAELVFNRINIGHLSQFGYSDFINDPDKPSWPNG